MAVEEQSEDDGNIELTESVDKQMNFEQSGGVDEGMEEEEDLRTDTLNMMASGRSYQSDLSPRSNSGKGKAMLDAPRVHISKAPGKGGFCGGPEDACCVIF